MYHTVTLNSHEYFKTRWGGNAKTAIICAITPATHHAEETLTSFKFASRAKKDSEQCQNQ